MKDKTYQLTLHMSDGSIVNVGEIAVPAGSGDTTYRGNAITGTSTTPTAFPNTGITNAKVGDWYINTSNGNVYQCTVAGNASTAKWVYIPDTSSFAKLNAQNTFTAQNIFNEGVEVFGRNNVPLQNTLYKVNKNGFIVVTGNAPFYQNRVKFNLDTNATTAKEYFIATNEDLDKKQPLLVSGTNVKTINGQSILGSGNLEISGGGSPDSNEPVLISVASTNSYRIDPLDQLSQHKIRVRVISGTLQAGDRLEICRPIAKKSYNLVNGVKKNVRWKQKLKACAHKILTETDIANIAAGKNILVLTVNHSSNTPNKGLYYTCTSDNNGYGASAPRTIRIVRPTPYGQNGIMQNIQISNSVYVTRSYGSNVIKGM